MDSAITMIRRGFLTPEDRKDLVQLAREGLAEHWLGRRVNALVLVGDGWSCESVANAFLLDDDTIRTWYRLFTTNSTHHIIPSAKQCLGS